MEVIELWKKVPGYKYIEVSNLGRVKRLAHGRRSTSIIQSAFAKDRDGYCRCSVMRDDGNYT